MGREIRVLEDRFWSQREKLLMADGEDALALADAPPLRSGTSARASKPTIRNKAATVS
jgi:hypothetical protein